jgi:hypothetical protein
VIVVNKLFPSHAYCIFDATTITVGRDSIKRYSMTAKLFRTFEGDLYRDYPTPEFKTPTRTKFEWHFRHIEKAREVASTLRAGKFAWPGGYPLYFIADDGQPLCFDCVRKEFALIARSMIGNYRDGWTIAACDINYEDEDCYCAHCNKQIEPAYK